MMLWKHQSMQPIWKPKCSRCSRLLSSYVCKGRRTVPLGAPCFQSSASLVSSGGGMNLDQMLGRVTHAPSFPRARIVGALLGLDMFAADGCSSLNVAQMYGRLSFGSRWILCIVGRLLGSLLYGQCLSSKRAMHSSHGRPDLCSVSNHCLVS